MAGGIGKLGENLINFSFSLLMGPKKGLHSIRLQAYSQALC